ncbi:MAG: hypothetical protein V1773_18305 [bacterium]
MVGNQFIYNSESRRFLFVENTFDEEKIGILLELLKEQWFELSAITKLVKVGELFKEYPGEKRISFIFANTLQKYRFTFSEINNHLKEPYLQKLISSLNKQFPNMMSTTNVPLEDTLDQFIEELFENCIDQKFYQIMCYNNKGVLALRRGDWQRAFQNIITAVIEDTKLAFEMGLEKYNYLSIARYNLGLCYEMLTKSSNINRDQYRFKNLLKLCSSNNYFNMTVINREMILPSLTKDDKNPLEVLKKYDPIMQRKNEEAIESPDEIIKNPFFGNHNALLVDIETDFTEIYGVLPSNADKVNGEKTYRLAKKEMEKRNYNRAVSLFQTAAEFDPNLLINCEIEISNARFESAKDYNKELFERVNNNEYEEAINKLHEFGTVEIAGENIIELEKYEKLLDSYLYNIAKENIKAAENIVQEYVLDLDDNAFVIAKSHIERAKQYPETKQQACSIEYNILKSKCDKLIKTLHTYCANNLEYSFDGLNVDIQNNIKSLKESIPLGSDFEMEIRWNITNILREVARLYNGISERARKTDMDKSIQYRCLELGCYYEVIKILNDGIIKQLPDVSSKYQKLLNGIINSKEISEKALYEKIVDLKKNWLKFNKIEEIIPKLIESLKPVLESMDYEAAFEVICKIKIINEELLSTIKKQLEEENIKLKPKQKDLLEAYEYQRAKLREEDPQKLHISEYEILETLIKDLTNELRNKIDATKSLESRNKIIAIAYQINEDRDEDINLLFKIYNTSLVHNLIYCETNKNEINEIYPELKQLKKALLELLDFNPRLIIKKEDRLFKMIQLKINNCLKYYYQKDNNAVTQLNEITKGILNKFIIPRVDNEEVDDNIIYKPKPEWQPEEPSLKIITRIIGIFKSGVYYVKKIFVK